MFASAPQFSVFGLPPFMFNAFIVFVVLMAIWALIYRFAVVPGPASGQTSGSSLAAVDTVPARPGPAHMHDAHSQLEAVGRVRFETRRLMNQGEYRVFVFLEGLLARLEKGHRVMAQTSLGELVGPDVASGSSAERRNAQAAINAEHLDFAVIDKTGKLVWAVAYQGNGHHQGEAALRDAVTREALRRADVEMIEVTPDWTASELEAHIRSTLGQDPAAPVVAPFLRRRLKVAADG